MKKRRLTHISGSFLELAAQVDETLAGGVAVVLAAGDLSCRIVQIALNLKIYIYTNFNIYHGKIQLVEPFVS